MIANRYLECPELTEEEVLSSPLGLQLSKVLDECTVLDLIYELTCNPELYLNLELELDSAFGWGLTPQGHSWWFNLDQQTCFYK